MVTPRHLLAVLVAALAAVVAAPASGAPNLLVGISDDYLKSEPHHAAPALRELGVGAVRLTLDWHPGQTQLMPHDAKGLQKAVDANAGVRLIAAVYSDRADDAPRTAAARDEYCRYVKSVVERFPQINDVVIWNEPNKSSFWRPQFNADGSSAAPAEYAALLAHCYDVLHAFRPGINVIHAGLSSTGNDRPDASSNVSHSPGNFIRKEGEALRAGLAGRRPAAAGGRFFDTFAHHPYGENASERPWKRHDASSTIGIGDWGKLMQALWDAFRGTGQPAPGQGLAVWYLEVGFQTTIPFPKNTSYQGSETDPNPVSARAAADAEGPVDHATQLRDAIQRAYCQPYVTGYFNFLLKDEPVLSRWQSGVMYADWSPKPGFAALRTLVQQVKTRSVDCGALAGGPVEQFAPRTGVAVAKVAWPRAKTFNWKHNLWRFRIQLRESAVYDAAVVKAGKRAAKGKGGKSSVLQSRGELRKLYFSWVVFPRQRLAPGRYCIQVVLTSRESSARSTRLKSPCFTVGRKR